MNKKSKVLIIIPAYNEQDNILNVVKDIKENAKKCDYIIVNDGSTDKTLEVCKENKLNVIDIFINLGLWGAVQTGLKYAIENDYDIAIQFDGDGQHEARYIYKLVDEIEKGNNIVIGSRFYNVKKPYSLRMIGSSLISFIIKVSTNKTITDPTSGLRALDKNTIKEYATNMNNPPEPDTLVYMLRKKRKIKEIQVNMREREFGTSIFNFSHTIKYMGRMIVSILLIQPFRK